MIGLEYITLCNNQELPVKKLVNFWEIQQNWVFPVTFERLKLDEKSIGRLSETACQHNRMIMSFSEHGSILRTISYYRHTLIES